MLCLTDPYCCQPAFTQTLWLPFPFDSKGASLPSDSFFSSPEADVRLRLLRVAYSCRVITPCLSIQLVARLMRSFGVYFFLYRRLTPPMSRSRTVLLLRCLTSWGDDKRFLNTAWRQFTNKREEVRIRKLISYYFGLQPIVLKSWITSLTLLWNACCHHSRVEGKVSSIMPVSPRRIAHSTNRPTSYTLG